MEIPLWLSVLLLVISILFTAFFSLSETAYACVNKYKYRALAKEGNRAAKVVVFLSERFDSTLITVLIGNNIFAIFISVLSTFLFLALLGQYIPETVLSILVSVMMAFIIFLFGDTIPKLLAKKMPDTFARVFCYPLALFFILFFPLSILFRGLQYVVSKLFRSKEKPELTEDDLVEAIEEAEEDGLLEENESDIIQATLEFDDIRVAEVLTPLKKMAMINASGLTKEKLLDFLKKCPYSRIPVYYNDRNKIVGILVVRDFLSDYFSSPKDANFVKHLKTPKFVRPSIHLDDLVSFFQDKHTQVAIVKSGQKVLGMVTTEDALEKLVGMINEKRETVTGGKGE
ncbi:MAG: hemolysin family protein [Bacilli bacterium]|nr:hemolysin family protein [Bacilli bacterium]